jgi:hypothetical protein
MTKRFAWFAISILVLSLTPTLSFGQAVFGSIFGTVTDPQGAALPNATVTVTDVSKGTTDTATTNDSGNYSVTHLIPDVYSVKVESSGFKTFEQKTVTVAADQSQKIDAQLQVGTTSETVEVTGEAPQLQTDRADVAIQFNQTYVENLPTFNRNFTNFELLTPGTQRLVGWSHAATENPQAGGQIFVNGQHFSGTGFELDGTDNQDPILGIIVINPNLDAVTEAKFALQDYDAEKGNAVAGNVSSQTKSGTNEFHGSAFWFRRTGANQARDPFTQYAPDPVTHRFIPGTKWQQFGGTIGGPIIKNKLFFFGDYQGTRQSVGTTNVLTVPTALVHQTCTGNGVGNCDMSQYLGFYGGGQIYNPATGNPLNGQGRTAFMGNQISNSLISPQAVAFLQLLPLPNVAGINNGTFNNYVVGGAGPYNQNAFDTRIDWTASNTVNVFGRYSLSYFTLSGQPSLGAAGGIGFGPGPGLAGSSTVHNYSLATGVTKTFSPTWLADFRFGWMKYNPMTQKFDAGTTPMQALGWPGLNITNQGAAQAAATSGLSAIFNDNGNYPPNGNDAMSNFGTGLNVSRCNCPLIENESQYQGVTNWTHILGNHLIKFGADIRSATNLRVPSDANRTGQLNFKAASTSNGGLQGLDLGSFLLGDVGTFNRYYSSTLNASEHQWRFFFYGQDSWRATPKLTINYGLRWEIYTPESVNGKGNGGFANISLAGGPGDGVIRVAGYGPWGNNGNISNNLHAFAPRFGFAYQLSDRMVIRGGFGVSYDIGVFGSNFGHTVTQNLPVLQNQNVDATSTVSPNASVNIIPAFTLAQGPPTPTTFTISSAGTLPLAGPNNNVQPKVRPLTQVLPAVMNYNLTMQYQWTKNMTMEIGYVGNEGRHGFVGESPGYNVNPVNIAGWALTQQGLLPQADRQYFNGKFSGGTCCAGGILGDYLGNDANSSYNSLQVKATQNMNHGLQFIAFYTWSRSLHYSGPGANAYAIYPRLTYGPWDQNRSSVFVLNSVYYLPFGKGKQFGGNVSKGWDMVIGGWQVTGTLNYSSGLPFTPSYADCGADEDVGVCYPIRNNNAFPLGGGNFNPVTHSVSFFTPVATMSTPSVPGQPLTCSGGWCRPLPGTLGSAGYDFLYGPRYFGTDMSVMKDFKLTERFVLQFRMDAFNIFNHPVLGFNANQGNTCIDCAGAGLVTDIESDTMMRALQFALRLHF